MTKADDQILDELFALARAADTDLPEGLQARVLHDAKTFQTDFSVDNQPAIRPSFWSQFMEIIGGWPALGGVAAAGVTGLWLGLAPTSALDGFAADIVGGTTTVSFIQDFDFMAEDAIDG